MDIYDKGLLKAVIPDLLVLDLVGVKIVSQGEEGSSPNKRYVVKFTVPESVSVDYDTWLSVVGDRSNLYKASCDDLIKAVKQIYYKMIDPEEMFSEAERKQYLHFLCKTRKGETWDTDKFTARQEVLVEEVNKIKDFTQGFNPV